MKTGQDPLTADRKMRFGGLLENPWISKIQRAFLDSGRLAGLRSSLRNLAYTSLLDVGCGLGECAALRKGFYTGLDNSLARVRFAADHNRESSFLVGDALRLPFADKSFEMVLLIDTSHHLDDEQVKIVLSELCRVSRHYIVISDPVRYPGQNALSKYFYSLDRGACFRSEQQSHALFALVPGLSYRKTIKNRTFPGLYLHQAFIFEVDPSG